MHVKVHVLIKNIWMTDKTWKNVLGKKHWTINVKRESLNKWKLWRCRFAKTSICFFRLFYNLLHYYTFLEIKREWEDENLCRKNWEVEVQISRGVEEGWRRSECYNGELCSWRTLFEVWEPRFKVMWDMTSFHLKLKYLNCY